MKVEEERKSPASGKGGQNVRLAAKLTSWKLDIQSTKGASVVSADRETVKIDIGKKDSK